MSFYTSRFCKSFFQISLITNSSTAVENFSRQFIQRNLFRSYSVGANGMDLDEVVRRLQKLAPTNLAASWDNVGLLVEPSPPHVVSELLLTNDLTVEVFEEALEKKVGMIISYHPPIFKGLKKLTQRSWKERLIVKCIENKMAVYSTHTSFDIVNEGITDWLISPFGGKSEPVKVSLESSSQFDHIITVNIPTGMSEEVESKLSSISGVCVSGYMDQNSLVGDGRTCQRISLSCTKKSLPRIVEFFKEFSGGKCFLEIVDLAKEPLLGCGEGRITSLKEPISISTAVDLVKSHLKLSHVRLACAVRQSGDDLIRSVAVCAGSGGSVLNGVKADLYLTGEMSHHEVLDATQNGTTVILCDHSNTERGFLAVLRERLEKIFENKMVVHVSQTDRDPLTIV